MFRAIGLVIMLLAIRILMPMVFHGLTDTLVQFFGVLQHTLTKGDALIQGAASLLPLAPF